MLLPTDARYQTHITYRIDRFSEGIDKRKYKQKKRRRTAGSQMTNGKYGLIENRDSTTVPSITCAPPLQYHSFAKLPSSLIPHLHHLYSHVIHVLLISIIPPYVCFYCVHTVSSFFLPHNHIFQPRFTLYGPSHLVSSFLPLSLSTTNHLSNIRSPSISLLYPVILSSLISTCFS
ncbi:hypothetical protein L211DRAFT_336040 [Terfezia boudieri ATCC MYA-4762]|uniref:Uncharacterized protein n=1 Tax=Terfezia boudieri ATCC MYA-4762 TaxID=1051890 RepID=A0A3N4LLM3_9PEZI|nr:hypothetical protein L211DRAFT_336040 [Terfezia boudieri ATCC MYA-4762]